MNVPEELLKLIKTWEGLRLKAYLCPAGIWTIGYGSTGPDIKRGVVWSIEQCEARLLIDAEVSLLSASRLCPGITGKKLSALADFVYNLGATRLAGSTLRRKINRGNLQSSADEFDKWVYGGGIKLSGLVLRRRMEKILFLS